LPGNWQAAAGVRQPLNAFAKLHPGQHVIDERFTTIRQAMAVPRGRVRALGCLEAFIEEMKADGFVANALERSDQTDATVAPPRNAEAS
jgi:polar amino acid transport system substrate-binding protein